MTYILDKIAPVSVWKYFEEICAIPHGSGDTKRISDYLVAFACAHGLEHYQDALNNVVIIKEASRGYEDADPIILQGHMDMVCEKDADCNKDMTKDGLDLVLEGDLLSAKGTTLGADDGIAVAMALAALADDALLHPRLEVILTVDEETGMTGARNIELTMIRGHKLLNLDSEEEGIFIASCAGGTRVNAEKQLETLSCAGLSCSLTVSGLTGGHSGADIHLGRANAHRILARALLELQKVCSPGVYSINGGTKDNVIPLQAEASLLLPDAAAVRCAAEALTSLQEVLRAEYAGIEPALSLDITSGSVREEEILTTSSLPTLLNALVNLPNGVIAMSGIVEGLTETSSNLGIFALRKGKAELGFLLRSMRTSSQFALRDRAILFLTQIGFSCEVVSEYSGWSYDPDSILRRDLIRCYEELFHSSPVIQNMHAGVECGILSQKIPGLDCVSIGPQIDYIHTSREQVSVSSVARCWDLVKLLLKSSC